MDEEPVYSSGSYIFAFLITFLIPLLVGGVIVFFAVSYKGGLNVGLLLIGIGAFVLLLLLMMVLVKTPLVIRRSRINPAQRIFGYLFSRAVLAPDDLLRFNLGTRTETRSSGSKHHHHHHTYVIFVVSLYTRQNNFDCDVSEGREDDQGAMSEAHAKATQVCQALEAFMSRSRKAQRAAEGFGSAPPGVGSGETNFCDRL